MKLRPASTTDYDSFQRPTAPAFPDSKVKIRRSFAAEIKKNTPVTRPRASVILKDASPVSKIETESLRESFHELPGLELSLTPLSTLDSPHWDLPYATIVHRRDGRVNQLSAVGAIEGSRS